ncbi:MAG: hypothetical protein PVH88_23390 [Ignavibacteria bacterium]|jgi:hypothetical protein
MNKKNDLINEKTDGVTFKTHYSGFGWFLFTVIGMSAKPYKVELIGEETGKVLRTTTDPEELKRYVGR